MKFYNVNFIMIEAKNETKVNIFAENEYYNKVHVAHYDFYFMEGWYYDIEGKQKEVKRFSAIMNYLFKQNERLCWEQVIIEKAKQNAKRIRSDEKKRYLNELEETDEKKASDLLEGIKQYKEKYTAICKAVENKTDEELYQLVVNTFKHASKKTINDVIKIIKAYNDGSIVYLQNEVKQDTTPQTDNDTKVAENDFNSDTPEIFYVGNYTFNTYSEAFNYTIQKGITTTKILSSNHHTMTNDRLQQLERSFVFDKSNMSYEDKKDYFDYLEGIPNSLDRENRYYKLKSWIERYEVQQQRQQKEKDRIHNLGLEASKTLEYMVEENGLEIKENESYVKYYFNGQDVHTWFSGISADKYHEGIMNIYNRYFKVSS